MRESENEKVMASERERKKETEKEEENERERKKKRKVCENVRTTPVAPCVKGNKELNVSKNARMISENSLPCACTHT